MPQEVADQDSASDTNSESEEESELRYEMLITYRLFPSLVFFAFHRVSFLAIQLKFYAVPQSLRRTSLGYSGFAVLKETSFSAKYGDCMQYGWKMARYFVD